MSLQDEDIIDHQETKEKEDKERNRQFWRRVMLERVMREKVAAEHWDTFESRNFKWLIEECAPQGLRKAVIKDMGFHKVLQWLHKELMKFYDKG